MSGLERTGSLHGSAKDYCGLSFPRLVDTRSRIIPPLELDFGYQLRTAAELAFGSVVGIANFVGGSSLSRVRRLEQREDGKQQSGSYLGSHVHNRSNLQL